MTKPTPAPRELRTHTLDIDEFSVRGSRLPSHGDISVADAEAMAMTTLAVLMTKLGETAVTLTSHDFAALQGKHVIATQRSDNSTVFQIR